MAFIFSHVLGSCNEWTYKICLDSNKFFVHGSGVFGEHLPKTLYWLQIFSLFTLLKALAAPDLSTFNILFEVEWFFLHHYMLFIFPFYYLLAGKVSVLSPQVDNQSLSSSVSFFILYWLFTCTIFAFYYVTIITPISLLSGLNLNYMLNPPPLPVDWVQGPNYRLISCVLVFTVFALFRGIFMVLEILLRSFIPIATRKSKAS